MFLPATKRGTESRNTFP